MIFSDTDSDSSCNLFGPSRGHGPRMGSHFNDGYGLPGAMPKFITHRWGRGIVSVYQSKSRRAMAALSPALLLPPPSPHCLRRLHSSPRLSNSPHLRRHFHSIRLASNPDPPSPGAGDSAPAESSSEDTENPEVAAVREALRERREKEKDELSVGGVLEEVREIEWPVFGRVLGITGVVLAVIAGSSLVLLTVNVMLAELSDRVFAGRGVQDFFS